MQLLMSLNSMRVFFISIEYCPGVSVPPFASYSDMRAQVSVLLNFSSSPSLFEHDAKVIIDSAANSASSFFIGVIL